MYLDSCDKCTMAEIRSKVKWPAMATVINASIDVTKFIDAFYMLSTSQSLT
jgi:hypothetical protein